MGFDEMSYSAFVLLVLSFNADYDCARTVRREGPARCRVDVEVRRWQVGQVLRACGASGWLQVPGRSCAGRSGFESRPR